MLKTIHLRPLVSGLRRYSQDVKDLFKFYSDDDHGFNQHRTLDEKDYSRFLSRKAVSQKPAPTRQLIVQTERSTRKISRSLAEGMPNEATFPFTNLELTTRSGQKLVIGGEDLDLALQYIPPRGGLRWYSQDARNLYKFHSDGDNEFNKYRTLDEKDYKRFLSKKASSQITAPTRQLIVQIEKRKTKISRNLAEGMPNETTFPFTKLELTDRSGKKYVTEGEALDLALQYIPTKGLPCLITELQKFQQELHKPPPLHRDLLVTNGAQHGIHLCTELLVDPGDPVISTEYTYTGLHYILKPYHVDYIGIPEDKDGLIPELLESVLNKRLARGLKMPRVLYLIPTVSNPTGFLLSEERRRRIYEIACKYDLIIVEDEVYMFLNYTGEVLPSFLSLDTTGRVLRIDSFSKVISAGLRVGWLTGPTPLIMYAELASLSQMLHPCTLAQSIIYDLMVDRTSLTTQLLTAKKFYKNRRDCLNKALKNIEDLIEWEEPAGGYFHWLKIRGVNDVHNMVFNRAFEHGLMLEPGQSFNYNNEMSSPYIRLTFARMTLEDLDDNIRTIGNIIREEKKLTAVRDS